MNNESKNHKIGEHGAVSMVGKNGNMCTECGKEVKPEQEEAHPTEYGYCCACDYDIAVMNDRIAQAREEAEDRKWKVDIPLKDVIDQAKQDTLAQVKDIVGKMRKNIWTPKLEKSHARSAQKRIGYNQALSDLLSQLSNLE